MTLTILGAPRTKKTSNRLVRVKGRHIILPSKANKTWANTAVLQLRAQYAKGYQLARPFGLPAPRAAIDWDVNVRALFYRDARRGDAVGYYQALADALQAAGVLVNDKSIVSWDGSRMLVDRANPRIELELTPVPYA